MLSDEEREIFNNLKDYMQSKIDNGYHKFIYNDLDWDFKCIDCINAIDKVLKQSKEIESLKEDNKKKSIVIIEYQDLYEKLEDKIKAKIEELKKLDFGTDLVSQFTANLTTIIILQSLLEKEIKDDNSKIS